MNRLSRNMKRIATFAFGLWIVLCFTQTAASANEINDLNQCSGYARQAVLSLAERDLIEGDENGNYNPGQPLSRERFVTLLVRAFHIDTSDFPAEPTFRDVPPDHWAYPYIEAAFRSGWVKGISPDTFGIGQSCTREQMAALAVRAWGPDGEQDENDAEEWDDSSQISEWARPYVDTAVALGLMNGTGNADFSPLDTANMEQSAVVLERMIAGMEEPSDDTVPVTLNGDIIRNAAPVVTDGGLLVPFDFLQYFPSEFTVRQDDGLIYILTYDTDSNFYVEASITDSGEAYLFPDQSVSGSPYDTPDVYAQNRVDYPISPVFLDSVLYVPADLIADATGAEYQFENHTLAWTDEKASPYPALQEALREKTAQTTEAFELRMKADFTDRLSGNQMQYDFTTTGLFDCTGNRYEVPTSFHTVSEKIKTTNVAGHDAWDTVTELVKLGGDLYTRNQETGQYEQTDSYPEEQRSQDFTFVSDLNTALSSYFVRFRTFEVYQNVYVEGKPTAKYVLRLSDRKDIAYILGNGSGVTINGTELDFGRFSPIPFPDTDYDALFFGRHGLNDLYPAYSAYSAKVEIYVDRQGEIVREVLSTEGNRYDYRSWYETWDLPSQRTYEDVDYHFVYTIGYEPYTGPITLQ